jgi:hypothetical protein
MPGCDDLKAEMAACWKVSWNVDPLALSVPLRLELLEEEPPAAAGPAPRRRRKPPPPRPGVCIEAAYSVPLNFLFRPL